MRSPAGRKAKRAGPEETADTEESMYEPYRSSGKRTGTCCNVGVSCLSFSYIFEDAVEKTRGELPAALASAVERLYEDGH